MGSSGRQDLDEFGVGLSAIREARERIAGIAAETPLKPSQGLSQRLGADVRLKLETMQPTGAFKLRGAANMILRLPTAAREAGVVAQSSGNHGRAVAWVARELAIPAIVFLPETVPASKVEGIRSLGAEIITTTGGHQASIDRAMSWAVAHRMTFVPPFDHPDVIAGQGTLALELFERWPEVDTIVVPLSGGGLMAGVALVAKSLRPAVRLVGVSMAAGAVMIESIEAGRLLRLEETATLADALAGELPLDNRYTFAICRELVDQMGRVEEDEIRAALAWCLNRERLVVEGGAAVGIAWLLAGGAPVDAARIAVIVTGDNVDAARLLATIGQANDAVSS